ncbi:glycosyltransferase family 2 protein [Shewanella oncorhynchi]|uniref:glycosyltransferase family 2 protein n=1 Tax=Shewanella oncorhynchi TaxID=2726434 RepID=UPI003D7B6536
MLNSKISVIMSVYNEEQSWISESISSILNQTYKNIELIIVNDNPDNIESKVIIDSFAIEDARVIVHNNKVNLGLIESLNIAFNLSSGAYIARMDADDISMPNRFEVQSEYLVNNNLDLIGSNVELFDASTGTAFYTTDKLITHKFISKMLYQGTIGIVHPTFFARRAVYEVLQGYAYAPHTEDKEFLARTLVNGFKVGNSSAVLLRCRYNSSSVTKTNAFYINMLGRYITDCYKGFVLSGDYNYDPEFYSRLNPTDSEIEKYNMKQKYLYFARKSKGEKKLLRVVFYLFLSFVCSSSTFNNVKVNLYLRGYRMCEKMTKIGKGI